MWLSIGILLVVLAIAVGGALIYRNNAKKTEATLVEITKKFNDLKAKLGG